MRIPTCIIALASALLASAINVSAADVPVLTPSEVETIKTELLAWKASAAGLEARKRGFVNPNVPISDVTDDEIARFARGKSEVERLSQEQPSAIFSMDTPYALLSYDEYLHRAANEAAPLSFETTTEQPGSTDAPTTEPVTVEPTSTPATNTSSTDAVAARRKLLEQADVLEVDWVQYGCVTPVKFRGACNAGWAFAAVGAIETNYCIKSPTRKLFRLSEQDVISCGLDRTCVHGITPTAFKWISEYNGGSVCTEDTLPFDMRDGDILPCSRVDEPNGYCEKPDLQVASYVIKPFPIHQELEQVVRQRAVTAIVNPCPAANMWYKGGVLRGDVKNCPAPTSWDTNVSHQTLLIVGFGYLDGIAYWKVKSPDGVYWGMNGYGYIERGYQGEVFGAFGIERWISYPLFKSDMPAGSDSIRVTAARNGYRLSGNDLKYVTLMRSTPEDCGIICRSEPGCKGYVFTWDDRVCTLKSSITAEVYVGGYSISSGKVVPKTDVTNGFCLAPEDNVDYPENDWYHFLASTVGECCDMCHTMDACNAYSWSQYRGGMCYLKVRRAAKPLQLAPPVAGGLPSVRSGIVYKCQGLQFNVDFAGNDLINIAASAPMDCCGICRNYSPWCVGFSWTDFNGGTCWLKSAVPATGGSYAPGVLSAII